jgi:hypothetical protein
VHSISFALSKARKVVRGLWFGLTEKERWEVACRTVEHLKEHDDKWKLNKELAQRLILTRRQAASRKRIIKNRTDRN